jgi:hypothetical protein
MSRLGKWLWFSGTALLVIVMLFGCAQLFWNGSQQDGWYIQLNIGDPGSKTISVEEYDVTRVGVELFAPGESLPFYTLTWYAGDDPVSELIPVSEQGEYRIEVTHVGNDNGEPVEAKESTNFNIAATVITVINVTPGAVGAIELEPGEIVPEEPIDLTGYWDWYFTVDCPPEEPSCVPEETGPIMLGIYQTDSTFVTDVEDFAGSITGSNFNMNSEMYATELTGTVSGSGDEIEITGIITSDFLGNGTFRIVLTAAPFGTLSAEGIVNGVDISINTEFALGSGGETDVRYNYSFPLTADWFSGNVWLQTTSELSNKFYKVVDDDPSEDDEINVRLWPSSGGDIDAVENETLEQVTITSCSFNETAGTIAGTFDLEFNDGSMLKFTIPDSNPVDVFRDLRYTVHFEVTGEDPVWVPDGRRLYLWFHVDVENEPGHVLTERTYMDHWGFDINPWESPSGSIPEFWASDPGTLEIERFDNDGIKGSFYTSGDWGSLNGNFDVYFYEEWEGPEDS